MAKTTDIKPPFTRESAIQKVQAAEDSWNTRDAEQVALAYSINSEWRNRDAFVKGRQQIISFLTGKWEKELEYRLTKQLWAFTDNRVAVRFQYEYHDASGNWFRAYGNENWEFDDDGLMRRREASINDYAIQESERKFHWPLGPRPASAGGLEERVK
jgi:nuclear transport factor 2 (NTF2) superfamily protein